MRIGLLSDTHGFLDPALLRDHFGFTQCDELWHAGDFGSLAVLRALQDTGKPVRAVFGNVDGADLRRLLPLDLEFECGGLRVYMTHIGGHPGAWDRRARAELERRRPDLFICGHSHILRAERDPRLNLVHLNPGACGHHGWHARRTALRFTVADGQLSGIEAVDLGPRGRTALPT